MIPMNFFFMIPKHGREHCREISTYCRCSEAFEYFDGSMFTGSKHE